MKEVIYMEILFCNENNKEYQGKLNVLMKEVFLDFQFWYDLNLWDHNYESYSIMENEQIVSNICLYKTKLILNEKQCSALSVGAVATKKEYRGRGYLRSIMEHVTKKYDGTPMYLSANENVINFYPKFESIMEHVTKKYDGTPMYLSANENVINFYPKFGFERIYEKLPVAEYLVHNDILPEKLSFDSEKVWHYVYNRKNIGKKLDCLNTASINLFHIYGGWLKDYIYDIPALDTIVIAQPEETVLKMIGVFSLNQIEFSDLAKYLPFRNIKKIEFGFTPYWNDLQYKMIDYETDPLFVRGLRHKLGDFKFPELSIT